MYPFQYFTFSNYFSVICYVPEEPHATAAYPDYIDYDHYVEYTCDPGYTHTGGDLIRNCTIDGSLTGSPPVCTRK